MGRSQGAQQICPRRTKHTVELWAFSVSDSNPLFGWYVRMSKQRNCDSSEVTTSLFIWMSLLSNSIPHAPLRMFVSHLIEFVRRSYNLMSPLSYPATTDLCAHSLCVSEARNRKRCVFSTAVEDEQSKMWEQPSEKACLQTNARMRTQN